MLLYITISLVCFFFAYFVNTAYREKSNNGQSISRQQYLNKVLLFAVFAVLFSLSALRIGIGNDYWKYRSEFLTIAGGDREVSFEIGFRLTVLLMQRLFGLDNYRVTFALFAFLTCFFFIKGIYDNAEWFFFSFFLFMANGFYFMSFDNVRYYFALSVCVYSMKFLLKKKYVPFVLWVCVAACFHKTILIIIPAFLVAYFLKWTKKTVWMIPTAAALLVAGKRIIRFLVFKFYPFYEGDLILDTGDVSYANIAKCGAILIFCLIFYRESVKGNEKCEFFFNLNLFALLLYSFASYVPELSRICYYMVVGQIFLIPLVLLGIKEKKKRILWTVLISLGFAGYYIIFLLKGKGDYVMILPYLTWLFQ